MGGFSLMHWLVFGVIAILLLGGGRFSNLMGDVAKGIKNFKKGMIEDDDDKVEPSRIEAQRAAEPAFKTDADRTRDDR
ncbi:twin-arginine translocase TatA/TatE family subunit [Sphingomonas sp. S1-29]|uniref:Sec-independent protein translocase protein TatA n=1 Tax=Sphingomonas qomolangmaensis TaxID=2918765 RepID=A0ABY5LDC1_9SPHN|nr:MULTISPECIES: twin-arginine translocase TatA/TatE family subunit [Sphingomonas]UUL84111.1 twin-arginine translocase TatA/TatE family subunit [Sphingomonas qomolangmaensis]UZK70632.1 twin-arginine translocase TatA/TatE family subunit [Sphingomonas sp. S1-29]